MDLAAVMGVVITLVPIIIIGSTITLIFLRNKKTNEEIEKYAQMKGYRFTKKSEEKDLLTIYELGIVPQKMTNLMSFSKSDHEFSVYNKIIGGGNSTRNVTVAKVNYDKQITEFRISRKMWGTFYKSRLEKQDVDLGKFSLYGNIDTKSLANPSIRRILEEPSKRFSTPVIYSDGTALYFTESICLKAEDYDNFIEKTSRVLSALNL